MWTTKNKKNPIRTRKAILLRGLLSLMLVLGLSHCSDDEEKPSFRSNGSSTGTDTNTGTDTFTERDPRLPPGPDPTPTRTVERTVKLSGDALRIFNNKFYNFNGTHCIQLAKFNGVRTIDFLKNCSVNSITVQLTLGSGNTLVYINRTVGLYDPPNDKIFTLCSESYQSVCEPVVDAINYHLKSLNLK